MLVWALELRARPAHPPLDWTTQLGTGDLCDLQSISSLGRPLLPDDVPAHDGGLALVAQPAIPGDPIEVALPQLDNLALDDLGGLLEGDAITLLEGRGGHSLSFLVRSCRASGAEEQWSALSGRHVPIAIIRDGEARCE